MSTAMNFSSKSFAPRPPDKGAFPLDHFGECRAFKERFMECLRRSGYESAACRHSAMAYLECRMDRRVRDSAAERSRAHAALSAREGNMLRATYG